MENNEIQKNDNNKSKSNIEIIKCAVIGLLQMIVFTIIGNFILIKWAVINLLQLIFAMFIVHFVLVRSTPVHGVLAWILGIPAYFVVEFLLELIF